MDYFYNFEKIDYLRGKRPSGCILCLTRDDSPDVINMTVFRNDIISAALNLYPYNPGHLLIFPNRHVVDIRELDSEERQAMDKLLDRSLEVLDKLYSPDAYNIGFNMGRTAGASVDHLHMHIIPRYPREIGFADLIAGTRVLVEDPKVSLERLRAAFKP